MIAARRPPALRGLILCATFARNPRPALAWTRRFLRGVPFTPRFLPLLRPWLVGRFGDAPLMARIREALTASGPHALRARLATVLSVDFREAAARVEVPVLDLRATHDRLVPEAAAELIAAVLPGRTRRDIEAPHLLLQTQPRVAAEVVQRFLAGLSS